MPRPFRHRVLEGPAGASAVVMELAGSLDSESAHEFRSALDACLDSGARNLVLDFERVDFVGSSGFAVVLACQDRLSSGGGSLLLARVPDRILLVVEMLGLGPIVDIVQDEDGARQALWGGRA